MDTPPSRTMARGWATCAPCSLSPANSSTSSRHRRPVFLPQSVAVRREATRLASASAQAPSFSPTSRRRGTGIDSSTACPSRTARSRCRASGPGRSQGSAVELVTVRRRASRSTSACWAPCPLAVDVRLEEPPAGRGTCAARPAPSSSVDQLRQPPLGDLVELLAGHRPRHGDDLGRHLVRVPPQQVEGDRPPGRPHDARPPARRRGAAATGSPSGRGTPPPTPAPGRPGSARP